MTVIPFPAGRGANQNDDHVNGAGDGPGAAGEGYRLTRGDLEAISTACCDLVRRGLAKGVVRMDTEEGERIVCVTGDGGHEADHCAFLGIGRNRDGKYYLVDSATESMVHGDNVQEVLAALP